MRGSTLGVAIQGRIQQFLKGGGCWNCTHKTSQDIEWMLFGMQYSQTWNSIIQSFIQDFRGRKSNDC